ncbi:type I DNA topoisomerase [Limibacillus halophilus]
MTAARQIVVVESPAKAKTINKYLGKDFDVIASYGHVRDLPPKDGSVDPDQDFSMLWEVDGRGEKRMKEIAQKVRGAEKLFLATDPDREGEAISWHIAEELKRRRALKDVEVQRVVFHEITKQAVQEAFEHPRDLNQELIDAYLARRALDYLVGFTLSPVLWRKLPGSRSAGRVQSVALRLICEREAEIEVFKPQEYWSIEALLANDKGETFTARLSQLAGEKLDRLSISTKEQADKALAVLQESGRISVASLDEKLVRRNPQPPFTTSTLQQEASRKLGFGASKTMRAAQKLYEGIDIGGETVGLITYMRTDGVQLSQEAIAGARSLVETDFGTAYLPKEPRVYKSRQKNAQEAHEAIRPTDPHRRPATLSRYLDKDELRLYELIWKRTLASQMESARLNQTSVDLSVDGGAAVLRASGSVVLFDGFLKLYEEGRDDSGDEDESRRLPRLHEGESCALREATSEQHFTQPPPRYSEASLIKRLEELGIGRPSTYTSILQVLQDRDYVRLEKRRFYPEDRGRLVTAFLSSFFDRYVEYDFTAQLEEQLDDISGGRIDWKAVLRQFWEAFSTAVGGTKDLKISDVIDALDRDLGPHFFPQDPENPDKDPRACPSCGAGRLGLRLGKTGGFIGCSNYPECRYTRPLAVAGSEGDAANGEGGDLPRDLGSDPESGKTVSLRKGPYGIYVQLGEPEGKEKPKRASLPKGMDIGDVTLEKALALLSLPRDVGPHPDDGEMVQAGIGRYGPYIRYQGRYVNIPADEDVLTIGLNRAVTLLAEAPKKGGATPLKVLGEHPEGGEVSLNSGRYGPYVKHGKVYATLPKTVDKDSLTLEQALELIAQKAAKGKSPAKKRKKA